MAEHYGHKMDIEVVARPSNCQPGNLETWRLPHVACARCFPLAATRTSARLMCIINYFDVRLVAPAEGPDWSCRKVAKSRIKIVKLAKIPSEKLAFKSLLPLFRPKSERKFKKNLKFL